MDKVPRISVELVTIEYVFAIDTNVMQWWGRADTITILITVLYTIAAVRLHAFTMKAISILLQSASFIFRYKQVMHDSILVNTIVKLGYQSSKWIQ